MSLALDNPLSLMYESTYIHTFSHRQFGKHAYGCRASSDASPWAGAQVQDKFGAANPLPVDSLQNPSLADCVDAYSCIVFERGDFSLHDFLDRNKRSLDNISRQGIAHQLLKGIEFLHSRGTCTLIFDFQTHSCRTCARSVQLLCKFVCKIIIRRTNSNFLFVCVHG
jgi:serine/threonine protein kinase